MMSNQSPSSFYDELSSSDRRIVDKWKEDRSSMLHDRLFKEIEDKISELGKDTPPSTSFLRLLVQARGDHLLNSKIQGHQATLTIWNPNEEQLDEIKEKVIVRVKNAEVKPIRFNGLLQLSGGCCCVLKDSANNSQHNSLNASTGTPRFPNFFRLFVSSSRQMVDRTTSPGISRENVVGIVLSLEYWAAGWSILLSDETGKLLRLSCDDPVALNELKGKLPEYVSASPRINLQEDFIAFAAFLNIIVTGVDIKRACLVGRYTSESSFIAPPPSREVALRKWRNSARGKSRLLQTISSLDVCPYQHSKSVVGYISGMLLVPSKELLLEVDSCGQPRTLKLPLSLILSLSQSDETAVFFTEKDEIQIERFRKLSKILRSRKSLYSFSTCPAMSDCGVAVQVASIHKTSTLALATLYSSLG